MLKKGRIYFFNTDTDASCQKAMSLLAGRAVHTYRTFDHLKHVIGIAKPDLLLVRVRHNMRPDDKEFTGLFDLLALLQVPFVISIADHHYQAVEHLWPRLPKGYRARNLSDFRMYMTEEGYLEPQPQTA